MNSTKEKIIQEYLDNKELYNRLSGSIMQIIESLLKKEKIKYASISTRIKDEASLAEKIARKDGKYKTLSDITDIAGIRIITYYADDVDKVAKLLEQEFDVDWDNSIDKRKSLKPNVFGYLSLHYIIQFDGKRIQLPEYDDLHGMKAEVQIRSILQHAWAEMEHDIGYKSKVGVPEEVIRDFSRLAGLLEIADKEFMEIRSKIEAYRVEVEQKLQTNQGEEDIKLDEVSIEALLKSDKEFIDFTNAFEQTTGIPIDRTSNTIGSRILELKWFGIDTVKGLRELLKKESGLALKLAERNLEKGKYDSLANTIGIYYLCFAKLLHEYSKEKCIQYMWENHIGFEAEQEEYVDWLFEIYDSVKDEL